MQLLNIRLTQLGDDKKISSIFLVSEASNWSMSIITGYFRFNNNGIKLIFKPEENLQEVILNSKEKTVEIKVGNDILGPRRLNIRKVSLKDDETFFNIIFNQIEYLFNLINASYKDAKITRITE